MGNKLYVGNLDWSVTNEELAGYFSVAGTVLKAEVIKYRDSGKSRGFAFVEMATEEEMKEAMKLDRTNFKNRQVTVREALPQGEHKKNELTPLFSFLNNEGDSEPQLVFSYKGNEFKILRTGVNTVEKEEEKPVEDTTVTPTIKTVEIPKKKGMFGL
jgi:cold-inducible RNA-binding protein